MCYWVWLTRMATCWKAACLRPSTGVACGIAPTDRQTLRAGEVLPLTLYWQAGTTTDNLYTVFVHLETLNGQVVTQIDSQPQGGGMPTASWATGQIITDTYPLQIPANLLPGAYQIVVGMYNPLDGTHLIDTRTGKGEVVLDPPIVVK